MDGKCGISESSEPKAESVLMQRLVLLDPQEAKDEEDHKERVAALKRFSPRDASVVYGVCVDKVGALEVAPVEAVPVKSGPTLADCQALLDGLKAKSAEREAENAAAAKVEMERQLARRVQRELERREKASEKVVELHPVGVSRSRGVGS